MAAYQQFKEKIDSVRAEWQDESYMEQFYQAYDSDAVRAEDEFKKVMEFREELGVDKMDHYTPPQVLTEFYTGGHCGYDKEGLAVKVELLGSLDMRGVMRSVTLSDLYRFKLKETEKLVKDMKEQGSKVGLTLIIDMEGVGMEWLWPPGIEMYIRLANVVEASYPGMVKRLFVVNTPIVFPMLWKLVRSVLHENIKSKIYVLGSNQCDVLLEYIPASSLPAYLGGALTDTNGDTRCSSKIVQGGKVPESMYLSADTVHTETMTTVTVAAKGMFKLLFRAESAGAVISYEFRTEDNDIGFKIVYSSHDDEKEEVEGARRVRCHTLTEDGVLACDRPGTYEVIFDNTYSVMTTKVLHYRVLLHQTDDVTNCEVLAMQS